ncbi:MAG: hypothetical protein ABJA86_13805 [Nocardioidaceae bacterium]
MTASTYGQRTPAVQAFYGPSNAGGLVAWQPDVLGDTDGTVTRAELPNSPVGADPNMSLVLDDCVLLIPGTDGQFTAALELTPGGQ